MQMLYTQSYITVKNMGSKIQYPHIYKWNLNSQKNVMSAMFLMTSCHQDEMTLFASQHFSQLGQILPSFGSYGCTCALHLKSNNTDRVWCQGISIYTRWFPPYKTAQLAFRLILGHNLDTRVPKGEKSSALCIWCTLCFREHIQLSITLSIYLFLDQAFCSDCFVYSGIYWWNTLSMMSLQSYKKQEGNRWPLSITHSALPCSYALFSAPPPFVLKVLICR